MKTLVRTGIIALAGTVGLGTAAVGVTTASAKTDDATLNKREDTAVTWVVDDDDDDGDDLSTRGDRDTNTGTRNSGNSRDNTNSKHSKVSRDRDRSRGDRTRDWTRDGGDRTRDFSRNLTNDGSRHDTRGR